VRSRLQQIDSLPRGDVAPTRRLILAQLTPDALSRRRQLALQVERNASTSIDLGELWCELTAGRVHVVDSFLSDTTSTLVLCAARPSAECKRHLRAHKLRVFERVLLRGCQKSVATELELAPSTIAIIAGNCLRAMGVDSGASRAPVGLVVAAHAFFGLTTLRQGRLATFSHGEFEYSLVSIERPDCELGQLLSRAEVSVARLLVEGKTHAEMSELRHTSTRTIANQLASAFAKLGVSGRAELLCRTIRRYGLRDSDMPEVGPPPQFAAAVGQ